jgi:hypothetical protein
MKCLHPSSLLLLLCLAGPALSQNRALVLDGEGDFVQLPALPELTEATVECWARWDSLRYFSQPFAFGSGMAWQALGVNNFERTGTLQFFIYTRRENLYLIRAPDFLLSGQWYHLAAVSGPVGMRLYVNGILGASGFSVGSSKIWWSTHPGAPKVNIQ